MLIYEKLIIDGKQVYEIDDECICRKNNEKPQKNQTGKDKECKNIQKT